MLQAWFEFYGFQQKNFNPYVVAVTFIGNASSLDQKRKSFNWCGE